MQLFEIIIFIFDFFIQELKNLLKKIYRVYKVYLKEYSILKLLLYFFVSDVNPFKNQNFVNFLETNKKFWKLNNEISDNKKFILITSFVHFHPGYSFSNSIIGAHLKDYYNCNLRGFIDSHDHYCKKILNSFGINKFYYLKEKNILLRIFYFFKALYLLIKVKNINEFLKFKYNGIDIGKIVYEDVLRKTGIPTLDKISFKVIYHLSLAINKSDQCLKVINKKNIKAIVQAETQFIPSAIVFQHALNQNIPVYSRVGINKFSVKIYKNADEIYTPRDEFSKKIFDYSYKTNPKKASERGFKSIKKRFLGRNKNDNLRDSSWAHNNKKNYTKKQLCRMFNWSLKKPIIFIFSHSLIDGNFTCGERVFKDNLTWLRYTLNKIITMENCNWVIKPHPMDWEYNYAQTSTEKEYMKICENFSHIRLYPKDLSSYSITKIAKAAVTSHGSSAFEYTSFGLPVLSAGRANYTKFNINYRAKTISQYEKYITNIESLKKPTSKKILRAKIFSFILNEVLSTKNILVPSFNYTYKINRDKFYKDTTKLLLNYKVKNDYFKKNIYYQMDQNLDHTQNLKILKNLKR